LGDLQRALLRYWDTLITALRREMARSLNNISYEAAGRALEQQRGLNTPERRLELASHIEAAIERYIAFEKKKVRPDIRTRRDD
jgi:hypothetical protein